MGLTALPFLTHSQKVVCLNALSPDFHPLHYSLNKVVEDSPGKPFFQLPPLVFLGLALVCLPFCRDPREEG